MVMMQLLFDSLSRCFGMPVNGNDHHSHRGPNSAAGPNPLSTQPLGASRSRNQSGGSTEQYQSAHEYASHSQGRGQGQSQSHDQHNHRRPGRDKRDRDRNYSRRRHHGHAGSDSDGKNMKLHDPEWDNLFESQQQHRHQHQRSSSGCCYVSAAVGPLDVNNNQVPGPEFEQKILAKAQAQHSLASGHSQPQPYSHRQLLSASSSSSTHKDVLRKARRKSTKRKLDIFRSGSSHRKSASSSSFASRLLGSESSFQTGAILCFANPIFDSEDDDLRLYRSDGKSDGDGYHDRDGEETINSTLYFDAKYEHMVEKGPPVPLYRDQALKLEEGLDDEIVKIFESGRIKHKIRSISYSHGHGGRGRKSSAGAASLAVGAGANASTSAGMPPPLARKYPGMTGSKSMADSSSDAEEEDHSGSMVRGDDEAMKMGMGIIQYKHHAQSYKADDGFPSQKLSSIPSPPSVSKSRQELDVISDWVFSSSNTASRDVNESNCDEENERGETIPPSLKLMNNSSLSTQALTPTPSASDNNLSPKKEDYKYIEQYSDVAGSIAGEI